MKKGTRFFHSGALPFHLESHYPHMNPVGGREWTLQNSESRKWKPPATRALTDKQQEGTSSAALCRTLTPQVHVLQHLGSSWDTVGGVVSLGEVGPSCRGWALKLHNPAPLPFSASQSAKMWVNAIGNGQGARSSSHCHGIPGTGLPCPSFHQYQYFVTLTNKSNAGCHDCSVLRST